MSDLNKTQSNNGENQTAVELMELAALIETLPEEFKQYFQPAMERAMENIDRRRRILSFIHRVTALSSVGDNSGVTKK